MRDLIGHGQNENFGTLELFRTKIRLCLTIIKNMCFFFNLIFFGLILLNSTCLFLILDFFKNTEMSPNSLKLPPNILKDLEKKYSCKIPEKLWPGSTIHSKLAVFDDQVSKVSSHNFNLRSEKYNSEITALVEDKSFSKKVKNIFDKDISLGRTKKKSLSCGSFKLNYPPQTKLIKFSDIKQI